MIRRLGALAEAPVALAAGRSTSADALQLAVVPPTVVPKHQLAGLRVVLAPHAVLPSVVLPPPVAVGGATVAGAAAVPAHALLRASPALVAVRPDPHQVGALRGVVDHRLSDARVVSVATLLSADLLAA
ncbi:jg24161 [Pararge aegeria aegeria]|uniref:Jg24161 protein n=1 Tax=Pararge aegeria aegeria TaxID=348720 RepID=A0A8S4S7J9_9NEOP|nr:jg24161 [Pararge aegeria aegeria]